MGPKEGDVLAGHQGTCAFLIWVVVICLLSEMLRQQYSGDSVRDQISAFNHHEMHESAIIFNMPFEGVSMSGLCVALDPLDLAIDVFWHLDKVVLVLGDAS